MIPSVFMPDFVRFAHRRGLARLSAAQRARAPTPTFYEPLRQAIVQHHEDRPLGDVCEDFLKGLEVKQRAVFPGVVASYTQFLREKKPVWFEPPLRTWVVGPLSIRVQPELGFVIHGRPHVLRMYFGARPPDADQVALTTAVMHGALAPHWPGTVLGILDVRRGKVLPYEPRGGVADLVRAEAVGLAALLASL